MQDEQEETKKSWEQLEGEPNKWFARFEIYRLLGPSRSIQKTYENDQNQLGKAKVGKYPSQHWYNNSYKYCWRDRAADYDKYLIKLAEERWQKKVMAVPELLGRISTMARANVSEFVKIDDATGYIDGFEKDALTVNGDMVKKIQSHRGKRSKGVSIEMYSAQQALETLGRHYGLFRDKPEEKELNKITCQIPAQMIGRDFYDFLRAVENPKYHEFLSSGGRGSLKSSFISLAIVYLLVNNPMMHALVMRQIAKTIRVSVFPQISWAIEMLGLSEYFHKTVSPYQMTFRPTGQKIIFDGASDESSFKSIKVPFGYIGINWFEELDQFKGQSAIRKIEQSTMRGGDRFYNFKSFNPPPTQMNWANQYWNETKPGQYKHFSNYLNSPVEWLGQVFLDEAEYLKSVNPMAYEHEYMGIVTGLGGMVFENIHDEMLTNEQIADFDRVGQGIDWGYFPDPFAWTKSHYDSTRHALYIFDEYKTNRKGNYDTWQELINLKGVKPGDLQIADSAEPKSIADFREYGGNCLGAEKGPGSIDYSMKWLQSLAKIVIDKSRCPETYKEFTQYEYEQDDEGNYISSYPDQNNHFIDSVRYRTNPIWRRRGQ